MRAFLFVLSIFPILAISGTFTTGIGYIQSEEYREENEINPLPLGTNILPMVSYRGENLSVMGPNISYSLLKGIVGFKLRLNVSGDRFKAHEIKQRGGTLNGGFSLRLLFLTIQHGADLFKVSNGNTSNISLSKPFFLSKKFMIIPKIGKEFLSSNYTNYYYGVSVDETGFFDEYHLKNAVNDTYGLTINYFLTEKQTLTFGYNYKRFDKVISNSPTISKDGYSNVTFFWNYAFK